MLAPRNKPLVVRTPLWADSIGELSSPWRGPDRIQVDTVVIGGGVTGMSTAWHLLESNPAQKLVVLDANQIGSGASSRNTGMLTPGIGQSLAASIRRFGTDVATRMYQASLDAIRYADDLTRHAGIDAGVQMTGQLILARGRRGRQRLRRQARLLGNLNLPCQSLSDGELRSRLRVCPGPAGKSHLGPAAIRLPVAGVLNPGRLLHGFGERILDRGGSIFPNARVVDIQPNGNARERVQLSDGRQIETDRVVIASGGYDTRISGQQGRLFPLQLEALVSQPLSSEQMKCIGWQHREGVTDSRRVFNYFRRTDDNRILFGSAAPTYRWGATTGRTSNRESCSAPLIEDFYRVFSAIPKLMIDRTWSGTIAYSIDAMPVIGPICPSRRVLVISGWCGHGLALGLQAGRWAQQLMDYGWTPEDFPFFRDRAPAVPTEPARWLGFRIGRIAMQWMDRI